jgi:hypothetical protein
MIMLHKKFNRCRSLGISPNPNKSILGVFEGKLLGDIVSKDGVRIDLNRVKGIQEMPLSASKKEIQCFFGQINFMSRFIPNFAKIVKPISDMRKKDHDLKWSDEAQRDFEDIEQALCHSCFCQSKL